MKEEDDYNPPEKLSTDNILSETDIKKEFDGAHKEEFCKEEVIEHDFPEIVVVKVEKDLQDIKPLVFGENAEDPEDVNTVVKIKEQNGDYKEFFDGVFKEESCNEEILEHHDLETSTVKIKEDINNIKPLEFVKNSDYSTQQLLHYLLYEGETEESVGPNEKKSPETIAETFSQQTPSSEHDSNRSHKKEKPFKCEVCSKMFSNADNFRAHQRIHTGEKPFKCKVCSGSFSRRFHLKTHKLIHTEDKPFKCEICGKSFCRNFDLKTHKAIHTGEKPFKCEICAKSFCREFNMKAHLRIHTGEKPFKCEVCSKSFGHSSHFKDHQRIHTGERPFKCEFCAKTFCREYNMKAHQRIHTGEKPFKCEVCLKSFSLTSNLKTHERIHTGEKPFKCDLCAKSFRYAQNLMAHRKIHS